MLALSNALCRQPTNFSSLLHRFRSDSVFVLPGLPASRKAKCLLIKLTLDGIGIVGSSSLTLDLFDVFEHFDKVVNQHRRDQQVLAMCLDCFCVLLLGLALAGGVFFASFRLRKNGQSPNCRSQDLHFNVCLFLPKERIHFVRFRHHWTKPN